MNGTSPPATHSSSPSESSEFEFEPDSEPAPDSDTDRDIAGQTRLACLPTPALTNPTVDEDTGDYITLARPITPQGITSPAATVWSQDPIKYNTYFVKPASPEPSPSSSSRRKHTKKSKLRMPTTSSTKRIKGQSISRPFIIGSEAWPLDETNTRTPDTPTEHTKGWVVYVRAPSPNSPPLTSWLKKVSFKIYHTYDNPTRVVEHPPFEVRETGWGGFTVEIRLYFVGEAGVKPEYRSHFLQLEPYGDEEMMERQRRDLCVRSEICEFIEFNEPTEALWDVLTSDEQAVSAGGKAGTGKGRAKGKGRASIPNMDITVEPPEVGTEETPFSKDLERRQLEMLEGAQKKLEALLAEETALLSEATKEAETWRAKAEQREKDIASGAKQINGSKAVGA